jgi:hypothetical protein
MCASMQACKQKLWENAFQKFTMRFRILQEKMTRIRYDVCTVTQYNTRGLEHRRRRHNDDDHCCVTRHSDDQHWSMQSWDIFDGDNSSKKKLNVFEKKKWDTST